MIKRHAVVAALLASGTLAVAAPGAEAHGDGGAIVAGALLGAVVATAVASPPVVYAAPPVRYYAPLPRVVYAPAPTYYAPPAYYVAPSPVVVYRQQWHWHDRGWRDWHEHWHGR